MAPVGLVMNRWYPLRTRILAALMTGAMVGMLPAQSDRPSEASAPIPGLRDTLRPGPAPGALPPWRPVKPAVGRTLVELTFINVVAAGVNTIARDIIPPSPGTWWDNIQGGWEWDPNDIRVNQLEHPWAGAAYFNSARANGLSFWGSAPMTLTGSMMWELLGESKPPSINDVLSTTLTGVALGEPLRRLTLIVVDEEAAGMDRFWREFVVFLANPGLGLNRLSRGQSWSRRQNPSEPRPAVTRGGVGIGARYFSRGSGDESFRTPLLSLALDYGDPFAAEMQEPFSFFRGSLEFVGSSPDGLGSLNARGLLARFGEGKAVATRVGGVFMGFDYRRDGVVEFAEQSFGVGLLSRIPVHGGLRLATDVSAEAVPILAVSDRYAKALTGRRYDYGAGAGARVLAELEHGGRRVVAASGRVYWATTLNGASETKLVQIASLEARLPPVWSLSLGASYHYHMQGSTYQTRPTETERVSSISLFLSTGH